MVFDPSYVKLDENAFVDENWDDFYGDSKEQIPLVKPEPRGMPVVMSVFSDADHAGNLMTRRSHAGILMFLNNAIINWYCK